MVDVELGGLIVEIDICIIQSITITTATYLCTQMGKSIINSLYEDC